jgi:hypothetical protein
MGGIDFDFESSLTWHTFAIDCFLTVFNSLFTLDAIVQYVKSSMKVCGFKNNLASKISFETDPLGYRLEVVDGVQYHKRVLCSYYRPFPKKHGLRRQFRVVATGRTTLEFRRCLSSTDESTT